MARSKFPLAAKSPVVLNVSALVGAALTTFATDTGLAQAFAPFRCKVVAVTLNVASKGGTHSTSTLNVAAGANGILTTAFDVAALTGGTAVEKTGSGLVSTYADEVAAGTPFVVSTAESGGTSPTWKGVTVQIEVVPLGE